MRGRNIETFKAKLDHAEACPHTAAESNLTDAFQRPQSSIDANVTLKVLKGSYALSLVMQRPPKPTARTHRAPVHQSRRDLKEISEGVARKFHYQKANAMKFLQALLGLCHWKADFLPVERHPPDAAFDRRLPFVNGSFRPIAAIRNRQQSTISCRQRCLAYAIDSLKLTAKSGASVCWLIALAIPEKVK